MELYNDNSDENCGNSLNENIFQNKIIEKTIEIVKRNTITENFLIKLKKINEKLLQNEINVLNRITEKINNLKTYYKNRYKEDYLMNVEKIIELEREKNIYLKEYNEINDSVNISSKSLDNNFLEEIKIISKNTFDNNYQLLGLFNIIESSNEISKNFLDSDKKINIWVNFLKEYYEYENEPNKIETTSERIISFEKKIIRINEFLEKYKIASLEKLKIFFQGLIEKKELYKKLYSINKEFQLINSNKNNAFSALKRLEINYFKLTENLEISKVNISIIEKMNSFLLSKLNKKNVKKYEIVTELEKISRRLEVNQVKPKNQPSSLFLNFEDEINQNPKVNVNCQNNELNNQFQNNIGYYDINIRCHTTIEILNKTQNKTLLYSGAGDKKIDNNKNNTFQIENIEGFVNKISNNYNNFQQNFLTENSNLISNNHYEINNVKGSKKSTNKKIQMSSKQDNASLNSSFNNNLSKKQTFESKITFIF